VHDVASGSEVAVVHNRNRMWQRPRSMIAWLSIHIVLNCGSRIAAAMASLSAKMSMKRRSIAASIAVIKD